MAIIDPPWRLDPLHTIVNISWGAAPYFLIGGEHPETLEPVPVLMVSDATGEISYPIGSRAELDQGYLSQENNIAITDGDQLIRFVKREGLTEEAFRRDAARAAAFSHARLMVVESDGTVWRLDARGKNIPPSQTVSGSDIWPAAACGRDGTLFVAHGNPGAIQLSKVVFTEGEDAPAAWTVDLGNVAVSHITLGPDGNVYHDAIAGDTDEVTITKRSAKTGAVQASKLFLPQYSGFEDFAITGPPTGVSGYDGPPFECSSSPFFSNPTAFRERTVSSWDVSAAGNIVVCRAQIDIGVKHWSGPHAGGPPPLHLFCSATGGPENGSISIETYGLGATKEYSQIGSSNFTPPIGTYTFGHAGPCAAAKKRALIYFNWVGTTVGEPDTIVRQVTSLGAGDNIPVEFDVNFIVRTAR